MRATMASPSINWMRGITVADRDRENQDQDVTAVFNRDTLQVAGDVARSVLCQLMDKLREAANLDKKGEDMRLFFPYGIELIDINVKVGPLVEVSAKIAGVRGLKCRTTDGEASGDSMPLVLVEKAHHQDDDDDDDEATA
jgi:hypothetical protein